MQAYYLASRQEDWLLDSMHLLRLSYSDRSGLHVSIPCSDEQAHHACDALRFHHSKQSHRHHRYAAVAHHSMVRSATIPIRTTPPATATAIAMMVDRGREAPEVPASTSLSRSPLYANTSFKLQAGRAHAACACVQAAYIGTARHCKVCCSTKRQLPGTQLACSRDGCTGSQERAGMECASLRSTEPSDGACARLLAVTANQCKLTNAHALDSSIRAVDCVGVGNRLCGAQDLEGCQLQALLVQIGLQENPLLRKPKKVWTGSLFLLGKFGPLRPPVAVKIVIW